MKRAFYDAPAGDFAAVNKNEIFGALTSQLPFSVEEKQRQAWTYEIEHLQELATDIPGAHIFLEFIIPRMGRRADAIIVHHGIIFVLEYKVGKDQYSNHDVEQTLSYALDLKNFHESSHHRLIVPILIATNAPELPVTPTISRDDIAATVLTNAAGLRKVLKAFVERYGKGTLDALTWAAGRYKPTPTIVEAAQALYRGHDVKEISRSEAGAENLTTTNEHINQIIQHAKAYRQKSICFITGVPGSGKTLAGLNIANSRMKSHEDEHAVFLSGNGPLVDVLREALTIDRLEQLQRASESRPSRTEEYQKACAFIQNIHHFRDENLQSDLPPVEKVVIFDEAQRAWDVNQTSRFMKDKRGRADFSMSEPEFLLSVMDRHPDWCTVICLVGGGQEINTGEAGITEWLTALQTRFAHWKAHLSNQIINHNYVEHEAAARIFTHESVQVTSCLHLAVSLRSFRAERLSDFVGALIEGNTGQARALFASLHDYPIVVTRSLSDARHWLRSHCRGMERAGLLASSNALRLKPEGVFIKAKIDPPRWFLAPRGDVRSSNALEDAGSEFDVQGLELDWTCVCWDANLRRHGESWATQRFQGTKWQQVEDFARVKYLLNSYRVLLTRARQGMVIFVPEGDVEDQTRQPEYYDPLYEYLLAIGIPALNAPTELTKVQ